MFKTISVVLGLALFLAPVSLFADPNDNVTPDQTLYKRVKALEAYGLLDPQDQKVLDEGRVTTRLELAFYTEKAKARLETPQFNPIVPTATFTPVPVIQAPAPAVPPPAEEMPPAFEPAAPPPTAPVAPAAPAAAPAPTVDRSAVQKEIDQLLQELHQESQVLRTHVGLDDYRLRQQQEQLDKLKEIQDEVDSVFKKSNKSGGVPHFTSIASVRVENVHVSGLTQVSATAIKHEANLGVWTDLGGKGSLSLGLGTYVYSSASDTPSQPASIYLFSPKLTFGLDGKMGHWDTTVAVETYTADTDLGDFTRGNPLGMTRYEDPFDIKKYSTDKNMKNWDDYMTNIGYVPSTTSFVSQSNTGIVFDGIYMIGSNLPLVSHDAKMTLLAGRMGRGTSVPEEHRWEEGIKYSQPWLNGFLQTSLSAEWINEIYGVTPPGTPALDLQNYGADFAFDLKPFFLQVKGGFSHWFTGIDTTTVNPVPLEAGAGQASLSYYPFTAYYSAISDTYAGIQSSVYLAGFNQSRFGYANADFNYGWIGMVDNLISDRYGWRANLGWKGRQQDWMHDWPSILDDFIINFDVAKMNEYRMIPDELGHNAIETYNLVTVLYPDDTGMWGSNIWGGYGGAHPLGTAYVNNITDIRNDGNTMGSGNTFDFITFGNGYSSRVPFILPIGGEPVQDINGHPVTTGAGTNTYINLDHLKTFNYITGTLKVQFNKMLGLQQPFYGGFFFTDHQVSGITTNPALVNMPDPNRPGQTLATIPNMFDQMAFDGAILYQAAKNLNLLADYGWETWTSQYSYPPVNWRVDALGAGLAYDLPWGGGKFELRYKHLNNRDYAVAANCFQADQVYSYFLFQF
ncbi:MAG TPA: hypothetical protein VHE12_11925 [bacterium]|nr:hypothetical protein [bacterium]